MTIYGNCDTAAMWKLKFLSDKTANQSLKALRDASVHDGCSSASALQLPGKKKTKPKHPPKTSARKSNPDIIWNRKTIPSPIIVLLRWSSFPNGLTQKREQWSFSLLPSFSSATRSEAIASVGDVLWVSVCPVMVSVGFVLHGKACFRSAACCSCSFCRVLNGCWTLADASGRVRGNLWRSWVSLRQNKHLKSKISAAKSLGEEEGRGV